jgi:hypothetical protein
MAEKTGIAAFGSITRPPGVGTSGAKIDSVTSMIELAHRINGLALA